MIRAIRHMTRPAAGQASFGRVVLTHDERHLRRKRLTLLDGAEVMVDLPETVMLADGDVLVLEDGRSIEILSAPEDLYAVTGRDALHLTELAWHLGNRHLPAQIEKQRILIRRDRVIGAMLAGLDARVDPVTEPFQPVRGAYHAQGDHTHPGDAGQAESDAQVAPADGRLHHHHHHD